ncbi:MAG: hypothetical protein ACJAUS_002408 [Qipengyuania sp.]|jgi:hypothetical protein
MGDWQPIETAPKDGTEILACDGNDRSPDYSIVAWDKNLWVAMADGARAIEAQGDLYTDYVQPWVTHWMPLPDPPVTP